MPNPDYHTNNQMFDKLLSTNFRIIFASGLSYLISEPLNSLIISKLKIKMNGDYVGIRFILSTIIASLSDSFIFGSCAFFGVMSNENLLTLIISMWLIKVAIEIAGLPISVRLTKKLKISEQLDIYDKRTNFNIFTLDTYYTENDNEFRKNNR